MTGGQKADPIWDLNFDKVGPKNVKSQRYQAKCRSCSNVMDGRVDVLYQHIEECKETGIPIKIQCAAMHQQRKLLRSKKRKKMEDVSNDFDEDDEDGTVQSSTQLTITNDSQTTKQAILTQFMPRRLTAEQQWDLNDCLTKLIVTAGIPFRTLENPYFKEFLHKLNASYDPPSRYQFTKRCIPRIHGYKLDDIKTIATNMIRRWRWPKPLMEKLMHQIVQYAHFIGPFRADANLPDDDPLVYWKYIDRIEANELVTFANRVLSLVPHSAEPERVFSILAHFNNKWRNRLKVVSLRILAQVKVWLLQKMRIIEKKGRNYSDFIARSSVDIGCGHEAGQLELEDWGENPESTSLEELEAEFMSLETAAQEENAVVYDENDEDTPISHTLVSGDLNLGIQDYTTNSQLFQIVEAAEDVELGY